METNGRHGARYARIKTVINRVIPILIGCSCTHTELSDHKLELANTKHNFVFYWPFR